MSKLSDFSAYEKMANMKNMLGGSFIEFLKPNIKTKQNDSVLKMLEIAKDKPDTYLELLAVAIFHKNFEIIKYMVEKFNITEADVPPMNALSFHNSIFPDNSPNILKDVKDNYNEVNCPFVIMSGIGGDINIFNYLLDHKLFSDKTQTGAIGLSKKLKNIINSNVIGACAYYGKHELLKHLLSNFKNEFDINFPSQERKSKIGRVGFSKEYTGFTPCMLAIVGPCEDKQTIEVLKILKTYNAVFNKEVFNKDNLLHLCVKSKKIETAKYLIEDLKLVELIDETNKDGHTPLSLSQNLNYAEFISYFGKDNEKDEKEIEQAVQDLINESDQKNKGNSKRSKRNKKKNNDLPALLNVSEEYQETLKVGKNQTSSSRNTYSSNTYSSTNNREKLHALFDSQKPKKKKKEVKVEKEEKKLEEEQKEEIVKEDEKEAKEEEKEEEKEVVKEHRKSKKVEELIDAKERGFKRIQNENTILITECNRLRKNLHEIYMHVVDIEQRFEALTNIDPKVSKSEIVRQIKEFIRITHEKIKENYSQTKKDLINPKKKTLKKIVINTGNNNMKKSKNKNNLSQTQSHMNETGGGKINNTEANAYVIFPEIRASKNKLKTENKKDNNNTGFSLPTIEK